MTDKLEPIYPKAAANLTLKVDGIFAFPEEWKTTDQANPGMFTYVVKFGNMEIPAGKIYPKQLTEKQLREQEQAKKKGGKKQAKKQQNPAQLQKLREQQEKQQAQERRRQEEWQKMSESERFHSASEDRYKSPMIRFDANNAVQRMLEGNLFVVFEERVLRDGGDWIYVVKMPLGNQQDLEKIKKAKPKTLNLADLNPICMRAWVDLTPLRSSQVSEASSLRCKLKQVDATQETLKPNLQKSYIKLSLKLSQPLLTHPDPLTSSTLIKPPPAPPQIPLTQKCVQQLHSQLHLALQSLAMQYSTMFWRDLNTAEQQKNQLIFIGVGGKKNQHLKRKEQFLYDFNVSGKYRVLKERLKKVIVYLCENKFGEKMGGVKSFTGITSSVRDQFYSQIYNFLVSAYAQTMGEMVQEKKQKLKQVFVLNEASQAVLTQSHLQQYKPQPQQSRFTRIISQHNSIQNFSYGQSLYKSALAQQPDNLPLKHQYSLFCLKNGLNTVSQVLSWGYVEEYLERNRGDRGVRVEYVLLMVGTEDGRALRRAWVLLRELIQDGGEDGDGDRGKFLLYGALVMEMLGKKQAAEKMKFKAFRNELRKQGKLKEEGKHQTEPIPSQIPSLTSLATYNLTLKPQQKDQLWAQAMQDFSQLGLYNIVQKLKSKLQIPNNPNIQSEQIKILYHQRNYKECKEKALALYRQAKDFSLLELIINCCEKLNEAEEKLRYLNVALREGPREKKAYALLNLGYFYVGVGKWGNAKACLTKYLDGNGEAGGLSWQLLGVAELMCGNYEIAVECFRHSNLCDPYNKEVWVWMAQAYCKLQNFVMVNQCLNTFLDSESDSKSQSTKLSQLKQTLQSTNPASFYDSSIKQKLLERLSAY